MTKTLRSSSMKPNSSTMEWGRSSKALAVAILASLLLISFVPTVIEAIPQPGTSTSARSGIVLRVRLADGSVEKVQLEEGSEERLTLGDVLQPFDVPTGASVKIGTTTTKTTELTKTKTDLKALGIKHGSMITVLSPSSSSSGSGSGSGQPQKGVSRFAAAKKKARDWDPYPEIAKDYDHVVLKTKTKRSSAMGMSYSDISKIQSSLHVVDPQKDGPLLRLYMCRVSAERFYSNGVVKKNKNRSSSSSSSSPSFDTRFGLLLGTINKERVDRNKPKKARTSLSSQTSDADHCTVAKVQAIWEPPGQKPKAISSSSSSTSTKHKSKKKNSSGGDTIYDAPMAASLLADNPRVLAIAKCLGLVPVGWIFSYQDDRLAEENSFGTDGPQALFGLDVAMGGNLKIQAMKAKQKRESGTSSSSGGDVDDSDGGNDDLNVLGDKFVTLAMDATTGATEAFQMSDVSVQMVHEDIFRPLLEPLGETGATLKNPSMIPTKHPVLVDGKETKILDSVLCLVNTAVLSHVGSYSGSSSSSTTKKSNGSLTLKTKKMLVKALDSPNANDFLKEICDFNILLALDELLSISAIKTKTKAKNATATSSVVITEDTKALCKLVKKWARGQKKGTVIDPKFKMRLKTYLS